MWPWTKRATEPKQPGEPPSQTATFAGNRADLVARLLDLEERTTRLERAVKGIDTDWSEWFDKFRRLYARIAKRQERDEDGAQSTEDAPETTIGQERHPRLLPRVQAPAEAVEGTAHLSRRFRGL